MEMNRWVRSSSGMALTLNITQNVSVMHSDIKTQTKPVFFSQQEDKSSDTESCPQKVFEAVFSLCHCLVCSLCKMSLWVNVHTKSRWKQKIWNTAKTEFVLWSAGFRFACVVRSQAGVSAENNGRADWACATHLCCHSVQVVWIDSDNEVCFNLQHESACLLLPRMHFVLSAMHAAVLRFK